MGRRRTSITRVSYQLESIGLIIDATDTDSFLYALPIADLVEKMFGIASFSTKLSSAGLIVRQLIRQRVACMVPVCSRFRAYGDC